MASSQSETIRLKKQIEQELLPFLNGVRNIPQENLLAFKDSFLKFREKFDRSMDKVMLILSGIIKETNINTPISEQILDLFSYVGIVESLGNCSADILIKLLIANKCGVKVDLKRDSLGVKIKELEKHGIKAFSSAVDTKLRNDIAHFNFDVKDNTILLKNKSNKKTVEFYFERLQTAVIVVLDLLVELAIEMKWEEPSFLANWFNKLESK